MSCLLFYGSPFSDVVRQSVSKEDPLGTLFQTFCGKAENAKPMVSFRPNPSFHGFEGLELERFPDTLWHSCKRETYGGVLAKP